MNVGNADPRAEVAHCGQRRTRLIWARRIRPAGLQLSPLKWVKKPQRIKEVGSVSGFSKCFWQSSSEQTDGSNGKLWISMLRYKWIKWQETNNLGTVLRDNGKCQTPGDLNVNPHVFSFPLRLFAHREVLRRGCLKKRANICLQESRFLLDSATHRMTLLGWTAMPRFVLKHYPF